MGLARYQPHALKDLRLSQIVATEFIQLLPERTTTIIPRAQGKGREREFDVILAGASLVPGAAGGLARSEMSIRIERKHPGRGGWFALPDASCAGADPWKGTRMDFVARDNVWRKTIAVEQASGLAYSLVIEEYEHLNDGAQGDTTKLVFFDRIALPGQT